MRAFLIVAAFCAAVASAAPLPSSFAVRLRFDDGSVELCAARGFTLYYMAEDLAVADCQADTIFRAGFE